MVAIILIFVGTWTLCYFLGTFDDIKKKYNRFKK